MSSRLSGTRTVFGLCLLQSGEGYEVFYPWCSWQGYVVPNAALHWIVVRLLRKQFWVLTSLFTAAGVVAILSAWTLTSFCVAYAASLVWWCLAVRRVVRRMPALPCGTSYRFYATAVKPEILGQIGCYMFLALAVCASGLIPWNLAGGMLTIGVVLSAIWFAILVVVRFRSRSPVRPPSSAVPHV